MNIRVYLIILGLMVSGCSSSRQIGVDESLLNRRIMQAGKKLSASMMDLGRDTLRFPRSTDSTGLWQTVPPRDWTSGFFPGCLWYEYQLTHDPAFRAAAEKWTLALKDQQYLTRTHDIGFIIMSGFGNGYRLTGDTGYRPVILQAAASLMTRYNAKVGCIRSWDNRQWKFPVIIDNMMNLELLFRAVQLGGPPEMAEAAVCHARKTIENHFRPDGSTYHVVSYDSATGNVIARETHQGAFHESVWARGQAWAVYGFTMAYRESHQEDFLKAAEKAADWFLAHLPEDHVPFWDFLAPNIPDEPRDASAAAIAASGLFELSGFSGDKALKTRYRQAAEDILSALCSDEYFGTESERGIIRHAVGNYPKNSEVDVSLIYGDYYFLEACARYRDFTSGMLEVQQSGTPQ